MGIRYSKEDAFIKERAKWEMRPVEIGDTYVQPIPVAEGGRGGAPFEEYPKWLHKPGLVDGAPGIVASKLVNDADAEAIARGLGWAVDQAKAVADLHLELATLAANRAASDRRMSEKAREEAAAVDETTMAHLPVIPEAPKRGRT